jgi:LAO/AO transport system kinase
MGDAIQAAKAGILEVGDVYVVNKATVTAPTARCASCATCSPWASAASRATGAGDPAHGRVEGRGHRRGGRGAGQAPHLARGDRQPAGQPTSPRRDEIEAIAVTSLRERMGDLRAGRGLDELADRVVSGELDPYAAADLLVEGVTDA